MSGSPGSLFDVAGLVGPETLSVMAFQGYPVIGCVIVALGAVLSMTAYILFLFSYILKGKVKCMSYRKVLVGIFMAGFLCCGIGAGVMFQEYSALSTWGKKNWK